AQAAEKSAVSLRRYANQLLIQILAHAGEGKLNSPAVVGVGFSKDDPAPRQSRNDAAHLSFVDTRGTRELVQRLRLGRAAEQGHGAPFPEADAEFAAVAH